MKVVPSLSCSLVISALVWTRSLASRQERLVEQEHGGLAYDGPPQRYALPLAAR